MDQAFYELRGRYARVLREDFCGTAAVCCEWVQRREANRADGVDIDPEVLAWARANNLAGLPAAAQARVHLHLADVRTARTPSPEIVLAMNFSYWLLKDRQGMRSYFTRVRQSLREDGVLFLDAYGGYDAFRAVTQTRRFAAAEGEHTYIWEQERYNPIDGHLVSHIHFTLADGSHLNRAFTYDWRLWTLPEIRELLTEAGFRRVTCYFQGWEADGSPDGQFRPTAEAHPDPSWICYLTAEK